MTLKLKPILPLALPLHLAPPLRSAHSHLGVRCHNSWRRTGVSCSVRAKQISNKGVYDISQNALQIYGFSDHMQILFH